MLMDTAREQMIEQQVRASDVLDERILNALRSVPRERFVPAGWRELADATRARAEAVERNLGELVAGALADLERDWPRDLPGGVIHADLFPDNVLFMQEKVSGLIDFYFACNDMYAYDLAVMLNSWCFEVDGAYNVTKGKSLIAAYRAVRALGQIYFELAGERAS